MTVAMPMRHRNIISMHNFAKEDILHIIDLAKSLKEDCPPDLLKGKIMASCFYEPSTRTRLSFEAAMHRLGGNVIGFNDVNTTSTYKGETLSDSMRVIGQYADVIVIRHPMEGSAQRAAESTHIPVINGGDGSNQHPTQTLLDLYSIKECQGRLEDLRIGMVGDLKYGRTAHSLAQACSHFNARLYFVSPHGLEMPQNVCHDLRGKRIKFSFHQSIEEILEKVDVLYVTRIQEERFVDKMEYNRVKDKLILTKNLLEKCAKDNLRILHPLPRIKEICPKIDATPYAYYFQQAKNGLYVRQAILSLALGKDPQLLLNN
jgi:aspartate carbamoyltransferase catalytic subunit